MFLQSNFYSFPANILKLNKRMDMWYYILFSPLYYVIFQL